MLTIAALGLAGVGVTINGWFARSLGSTDVAGWLFLALGVAADVAAIDDEEWRLKTLEWAAKRAEMGVQNVQSGQNEHLPAERVKDVLRADPAASVTTIMKLANVSRGTASTVRKQMRDAGAEASKPAKAKPAAKKKADNTEADRAAEVCEVHQACQQRACARDQD